MNEDEGKARRSAQEEIRKILFARPRTAWRVERDSPDGVSFTLVSSFDLAALDRTFRGAVRRNRIDSEGNFERRSRIWAAGGYVRTDSVSDEKQTLSTRGLEHPKLGAVYVDLRDRTYLHFSPEQLAGSALRDAVGKIRPKWTLSAGTDGATLSARGPLSIDVDIALAGKASTATAGAALAACLPGLAQLVETGLPYDELVSLGMPHIVTVWYVDRNGKRTGRLATHTATDVKVGAISPNIFQIPAGFRDLRQRSEAAGQSVWHALRRSHLRPTRPRRRRAARTKAPAASAFAPAAMMQWVPPAVAGKPPTTAAEPVLPSCLPATFHASCAYEVRQPLLDAIGYMLNVIGSSMTSFAGTRAGNDTDVTLTIDWLEQLQAFSEREPQRAGLFCLLREPPTEEDPVAGRGLLDRFAVSLARDLLAEDEPLPLGGDDPITLSQQIVDELRGVVEDEAIAPEDRFDELSAETQVAIREQVVAQRLGSLDLDVDGDFGEHMWPSRDFALLHVALQLEQVAIEFSTLSLARELTITVDDDGRPRIAFSLALATIDATVHMERWPGVWFWVIAPAALVVGGVVTAAAVGAVIATLAGLGPLGLLVLLAMLQAAPIASLASVAGGLLLLAAVTYLVWDVTDLRLQITDAVLTSSVSPDVASNPEEVVLDPDRASLEGTVVVSVSSDIPSGIHQLFDWIVNTAITNFDREVREALEDLVVELLEAVIRSLPHFCLPLPRRIGIDVPLSDDGVPSLVPSPATATVNAPRHRLTAIAANGVADRLVNAASLTSMEFPFPTLRPYLTQVDADSREKLTQLIERAIGDGTNPLLGYAMSQNLLNGVVFSRWLSGRYARDYDEAETEAAFAVLTAACPECGAIIDGREAHVWAAATPQVFVAPRAFLDDERRPYLQALFPDVRLCLGGVAGKPSVLEVQFSITAIAHVALGVANANGTGRSLLTVDRNFLHVLFDERSDFRGLSPAATQGVETHGPGFDPIAAMDAAEQLQFLNDIRPMLETAATRLLRRDNASGLVFEPESPSISRQIYDGMFAVDLLPRRSSIYATILVYGPALLLMPYRNANGDVVGPLDNMTCEAARELLEESFEEEEEDE